jgi:hypothetical protein
VAITQVCAKIITLCPVLAERTYVSSRNQLLMDRYSFYRYCSSSNHFHSVDYSYLSLAGPTRGWVTN